MKKASEIASTLRVARSTVEEMRSDCRIYPRRVFEAAAGRCFENSKIEPFIGAIASIFTAVLRSLAATSLIFTVPTSPREATSRKVEIMRSRRVCSD